MQKHRGNASLKKVKIPIFAIQMSIAGQSKSEWALFCSFTLYVLYLLQKSFYNIVHR